MKSTTLDMLKGLGVGLMLGFIGLIYAGLGHVFGTEIMNYYGHLYEWVGAIFFLLIANIVFTCLFLVTSKNHIFYGLAVALPIVLLIYYIGPFFK
jgi:hypothetical protein